MKTLARGSILLGFFGLLAVLFYFQPTAEAKTAYDTAISSPETVQQTVQTILQPKNQQPNIIEPSTAEAKRNTVFSEARSFRATAYCLQGRTASGGGVRRGIVAADPRVLPLGTRIQISAGAYSGSYTVADTGGAVRGRILDIWVPSCSEAVRFGRRAVSVSVVGRR